MTKADVIAQISDQTGIDKADVSATVEAFFSVIKNSMADGNNVYVRGFGSFVNKKRARKVEKVKVCFTIGANAIVKSGTKDVYLRVADKNGDVFPKGGDSTKVFIFEEKEIVYSAKRTIGLL